MPDVLRSHPKSDACRLCLVSTGQMEHIFSDPVLMSTITETVRLKVFEGDGLPDQICQPCIDQLNAASRFIQRCHVSDSELRLPLYNECGRSAVLEVIASDNTESATEEPRLGGDWACSLTPIKVEKKESAEHATELFSEVNLKIEAVEQTTFETVDPLEATALGSAWQHPIGTSWQSIDPERDIDQTSPTSAMENCFNFGEDGVLIEPIANTFLPNHLLLNLQTEAPLTCHLCSKSFTTHKALRCHINMGHMQTNRRKNDPHLRYTPNTPDRSRLWCSQCNAGFLDRDELVKHMRAHRGQSSYCCPRCDKGFHSQQALKVHTKTHAKEKRYKCTKCDKSFSLRSYFRVHELTHKHI